MFRMAMRTLNYCNVPVPIVSLLLGAGLAAQQMYNLGTLGGTYSEARAINAQGQVVGRAEPPGAVPAHAFLWTSGATDGVSSNPQMKDLGTLGGSYSEAVAINDNGLVAGNAQTSSGTHAFLWTKGGTDGVPGNPQMKDLGTLIGGYSLATSMNAKGQVAGESDGSRVFLWTPGGTDGVPGNPQMKDLGTLGGGFSNHATINDLGQVSGVSVSYLLGDTAVHVFLWTPGGTDGVPSNPQMKDLGTLGGNINFHGFINARGQVAGDSATDVQGIGHAFLWTPGATDGIPGNPQMNDLGSIAASNSESAAINDSGQVAGVAYLPPSREWLDHAFLWTPGGTGGAAGNPQMRDLGTLGGLVSWAISLNVSGRVAGNSTLPGDVIYHAFLWTPGGTDGAPGNPQMKDLGTLPGYENSIAYAINDSGQVVGHSDYHAFLYLPSIPTDSTPPPINPHISGILGHNGWYISNVTINWDITDPESGIGSSSGCDPTILTADTTGARLVCSATNVAGVSNSASATVKVDKTPPVIAGMPAADCILWPPNHQLVKVATVTAADSTAGLSPASFTVTGRSNQPAESKEPDIVIAPNGSGGFIVQLLAERLGNSNDRVYTLEATAADLASNTTTAKTTCIVPHNQ